MTKRTFGGTSRKRKRVSLIQVEELLKVEDKKVEKE